jgi:hypothetical protein
MQQSTNWIDSNVEKPPINKNVWGWDADYNMVLVVSYFEDSDGWHWANAHGNVFANAEFDADYDITYWRPILIPEPPEQQEITV